MGLAPPRKWLLTSDLHPMCSTLWLGDVLVTLLIAGFGLFDFVTGIFNYSDPTTGPFGTLGDALPDCAEREQVIRIAKLNGVGPIETGAATFIVAMYRIYRWWVSAPFNPTGILVMLTLDVVGTILKFVILVHEFPSTALTWCLVRGGLAIVALVLAFFTYRGWYKADGAQYIKI